MGMIVKDYEVTGDKASATVKVLYDTGAGASFVRRSVAEPLGTIVPNPRPISFTMADGREVFHVDRGIQLDVDVDGTPLLYFFYVVDDLAEELIIGSDMMQRWKMTLDLDNETVSIDPLALYMRA